MVSDAIKKLAQLKGKTIEEVTAFKKVTAFLLLDTSGSMNEHGKIDQAKSGSKGLAEALIQNGDRFGLIEFNSQSRIVADIGTALDVVHQAIDSLDARGGTYIAAAIRLAIHQLHDSEGQRKIFLVTDGWPSDEADAFAAADEAKAAGIRIETRGVDEANLRVLQRIATDPDSAEIVPKALLGSSITALARRLEDYDDPAGFDLLD